MYIAFWFVSVHEWWSSTADQCRMCRIYTSDVPNLLYRLLQEIEILAHDCDVSRCLRYVSAVTVESGGVLLWFVKTVHVGFGSGFDLSSERRLLEPVMPCSYDVMLCEVFSVSMSWIPVSVSVLRFLLIIIVLCRSTQCSKASVITHAPNPFIFSVLRQYARSRFKWLHSWILLRFC